MNPQIESIFIYSKYSANCKRIMDTIKNSGVNFTDIAKLTLLNVDNPEVRKRVCENSQFDITIVPCILVTFPGGSVEKYDGSFAYEWVNSIIEQYGPPPPPPVIFSQPITTAREDTKEEYVEQTNSSNNIPDDSMQNRIAQTVNENYAAKKQKEIKVPSNMRPIPQKSAVSSIEDLPDIDNLEEDDRHKIPQQPRRIRQDENSYIEDDGLFSGDQVDYRREPASTIKTNRDITNKDPHGTMARVKQLEREREMIEKNTNSGAAGMPFDARRP